MEVGPHPRSYGANKKVNTVRGAPGAPRADAAPGADAHGALAAASGRAGNVHVVQGPHGRIAFVSDIRGNVRLLNQIAAECKAKAIVHTGDFGFFASDSLPRLSDRVLRHVVQYSPLLTPKLRSLLLDTQGGDALRQGVVANGEAVLSEFPKLLTHALTLQVPVFTVWGACEDVQVLERLRSGEYRVPNLHVLDETTTHALDIGGLRLRLLGLGGAVVLHKLFDHGAATTTMGGAQGATWVTMLQLGALVESAQQAYDPSEVRVLVTHGAPGREGLLAQLAHAVRADYVVSGALHLREVSAYNEFGVHASLDAFREKLLAARTQFQEVWDAVKAQVELAVDPSQRPLLDHALHVALHVPQPFVAGGREESAWKNLWFFNLPDAPLATLVFDVHQARIATETRAQGMSFASRLAKPAAAAPPTHVALPRADGSGAPAAPSAQQDATLFLGHMGDAFPLTEADVRAYFGEHAEHVTHVHFFPAERSGRRDKDEGRLRTFVHVVFATPAAAQAALACRGRTIKNTHVVPTLEPLGRKAAPERKERKERGERAERAPKPPANAEEGASSPRPRSSHTRGGRGGRSSAARKEAKKAKAEAQPPAAEAPHDTRAATNGADTKAGDA
ncbi:hypothetical protein CBS9595_001829 [Malassezia furfur]|nr:hypothetical protein CBS9595_001829 [Malassezia furfur]